MIGVIVTFTYDDGVDPVAVTAIAEGARERFEGMPGLRSKAFTISEERDAAVNFYVWESREAARGVLHPGAHRACDRALRRRADDRVRRARRAGRQLSLSPSACARRYSRQLVGRLLGVAPAGRRSRPAAPARPGGGGGGPAGRRRRSLAAPRRRPSRCARRARRPAPAGGRAPSRWTSAAAAARASRSARAARRRAPARGRARCATGDRCRTRLAPLDPESATRDRPPNHPNE